MNSAKKFARFQQAVADYNKQAKRGYDLQYSVGHVYFSSGEEMSIEDLLQKADSDMYKNKKAKK